MRLRLFCCLIFPLLTLGACVSDPRVEPSTPAAFAMPDKYSARVVESVLREGGNAVDAAVAAGFTLAVTFPEAGNIGGGGFLLARFDDQNYFLDYREKAPLAASRDMYLDAAGEVVDRASLVGIRAAGVPGTVDGLWQAHQKFGRLSWSRLLQPAIELAEQGFDVHPQTAGEAREAIEWFNGQVNFVEYFGAMAEAGRFVQPELGQVLRRVAQHGPKDFYTGKTAQLMVDQFQRDGGLITAQDLASYRSVWRAPLVASWRNMQVVTAPPPSSGGFAVIQLLKMKALLDSQFATLLPNSAQYVHLIAEMEKRVFADRAEYFGDPDFIDVPIQQLISDAYVERRTREVQTDSISQLKSIQPGLEPPSTTHYSIVDKWGNAVSNTYTINWSYGSGVVVEGAGFLLNNEMDDFSLKPGVANVYGVTGGSANAIEPAKRMLSSMSPTILLDDEQVRMVLGSPGGSTIFTSVFQGIVNVIDNGFSVSESVAASRFHHQLLPPELVTMSIRFPLPDQTQAELIKRGYRVEPHDWEFGDLQIIHRHLGETDAASDPRGIGVSGVIE